MNSRWWKQSGLTSRKAAKHRNRRVHSLVGFLPVGPARTSAAVVSLDYEGVFLLALAVHRAAGSQDALSRCAIQHHRFKRGVLAVDLKSTDLPWRKQEENNESMHENCCEAPKLWPSGTSSFCRNGKFAMPTKKKKETSIRERQTLACTAKNKQNAVISSTQDKIVGKRRKETWIGWMGGGRYNGL